MESASSFVDLRPSVGIPIPIAPLSPVLGRGPAARRGRRQESLRKIATAFWPPKPKPLTATVSIFALRAVSGT